MSLCFLSNIFAFNTDTHYLLCSSQSDRERRSKISWQGDCKPPSKHHSLYLSWLFVPFTQTLTSLCVSENKIGDDGAVHLGNGLANNSVYYLFLRISFLIVSIYDVETSICWTLRESNWRSWSKIYRCCFSKAPSEHDSLLVIFLLFFYSDSHFHQSLPQSNRRR